MLAFLGRGGEARASCEAARRDIETKLAETPDDARLHSAHGIALAGLGRFAEAVRKGERGVALMPVARDAYSGVFRLEDLAHIQTMAGNQDAAIRQLEALLAGPSRISAPLLRVDPRWDPLRKSPGFESLLERYAAPRPSVVPR